LNAPFKRGTTQSFRQHQSAQRDQLATFSDMRSDRGVECASLTCVAAMNEPVLVAAGRTAFRHAQIFFV
jgi:hypothetical protein